MEKINNLNELKKLIGKESVEKCFTEYMHSVIEKAKKLDDLKNHIAVMTKDEMHDYIKHIDRAELDVDLGRIGDKPNRIAALRYLKAIRVSLITLGYDPMWVDDKFRDALEQEYLPRSDEDEKCFSKQRLEYLRHKGNLDQQHTTGE